MRQDESVSRRPTRAPQGQPVQRPNPVVARWIARTLKAAPPRATSLIVTVWGDALAPHGGEIWLSALIRLMAPFGMSERLVRTSVFRLTRDGWLAAESHGRRSRYRLTAEGTRRFEQAHQRIYATSDLQWTGEWEIVLAPPDAATATQRQALRMELSWEGFGTVAPAVYARPAHGESALPRILAAQGLVGRMTVLRAREDPFSGIGSLLARVDTAWPLAALANDYRRFLARFGGVIDAFRASGDALDPEQCFVARTLLIHAYRRTLLRDPQLPRALLPLDWPGYAAGALTRDFYRLTLPRAEGHLAAMLTVKGEALRPVGQQFQARFGGLA
jgi:phenylacetic acid degradation operon negative regulatory protein